MMNKVNINNRVRVVLTKDGADGLNKHNIMQRAKYLEYCPTMDVSFLKIDYSEGDIIDEQIWVLFEMFGDYFNCNTTAPFKNNEIEFFEQ